MPGPGDRGAIREKREFFGCITSGFIEFRNHESAAKGRLKGSDQESVVATRLVTRDRAKCVPANAIRHQPLARFRGAQVAANFAAEIDLRGKC